MNILIFGTGKMSRALQMVFASDNRVVVIGRNRFDATTGTGLRDLLESERPDLVCNTVVLSGIDDCERLPSLAHAVNTAFPARIAALSADLEFRFLHISSDAVFGNAAPNTVYDEYSLPAPLNVYGLTKFGADSLIPALTDAYHIIRLPLLFGPCTQPKQFFEKMLKLGLKSGELKVSDDVFSCAAYSLDVARRARQLVEENAASGLYHVAGQVPCSLYELLAEGIRILDLPIRVSPVSHTVFPSTALKATNTPLRSVKCPPLHSWRRGLSEYCASPKLASMLAEWSEAV